MIILHKKQIITALSIVAVSIMAIMIGNMGNEEVGNGDGSNFSLNKNEKWGRF